MNATSDFPARIDAILVHNGPEVLRLLLDESTTDAVLESIERIYDTLGCRWSFDCLLERLAKKYTQVVLIEAWDDRTDGLLGMGAVGLLDIDRQPAFRALTLNLDVRHRIAPEMSDRLAALLKGAAEPTIVPKRCDLILVIANGAVPCPDGYQCHAEDSGVRTMTLDLNPKRTPLTKLELH